MEDQSTSTTDPEAQTASCEYNAASGKGAYLALQIKRVKDPQIAKLGWDIARGGLKNSEKLDGIGDQAFVEALKTGGSAEVLKGNLEFDFTMTILTGGDAGAAMKEVVTTTLGRHK
jgi:hypothetical protein